MFFVYLCWFVVVAVFLFIFVGFFIFVCLHCFVLCFVVVVGGFGGSIMSLLTK